MIWQRKNHKYKETDSRQYTFLNFLLVTLNITLEIIRVKGSILEISPFNNT